MLGGSNIFSALGDIEGTITLAVVCIIILAGLILVKLTNLPFFKLLKQFGMSMYNLLGKFLKKREKLYHRDLEIGKIDEKRATRLAPIVDIAAKQSSEMERLAEEAEREVDDLKKAEYMMDRIGEEFEGIISSVTSFGIFVELPNTIEGLVHITDLDDDYYVYDEQHLMLLGQRTRKIYRLGDSVKVKCAKVDIDNREIFFDILDSEQNLEEIVPSEETASIIAEVKKEFGTKPEEEAFDV